MSTIATSGRRPRHEREELVRRLGLADDLDARIGEEPGESLAQERLVLGDHDPHGISATSRTRPGAVSRTVKNPVDGADAIARSTIMSSMIDGASTTSERNPLAPGLDPDRPSRGFDNVADDGIRRLPDGRIEWVDVDRPDRHCHRRTLGQAFDRGRKALIGKNARVDTVGHIAQLVDREARAPGSPPRRGLMTASTSPCLRR